MSAALPVPASPVQPQPPGGRTMRDERIIFELSETAALGADALQWILYRREGSKWRRVSFVRSTKAILLRCVKEKGLDVTPEGWELLAALLPDTFDVWKLARKPDSAENPPEAPNSGIEAPPAIPLAQDGRRPLAA